MSNLAEIVKNLKGAFYAAFGGLMALMFIYYGFDFLFLRSRFLNGDAIVIYHMIGFISFLIGLLVLSVSLIAFTFVKLNITDQKLKYVLVWLIVALGVATIILMVGFPRTIGQNMAFQNGYVLCLTQDSMRDRGARYYAIDQVACDTFKSYYGSRLRQTTRGGCYSIKLTSADIRAFNRDYPDKISGSDARRRAVQGLIRQQ
ncbi:MAG: hypothetical protein KI792_13305 [Alphaproteobacteria bacterium]|nr:hypothetical protein [Alphaproteobacteria bacterium SS10]